MSEKQKQAQQNQAAKKKPEVKAAEPALSADEELLQKASAAPVGLPADLPNESNSRSLRRAQFSQIQRLHGNAAVQRFLSGRDEGAALPGTLSTLQRDEDDEAGSQAPVETGQETSQEAGGEVTTETSEGATEGGQEGGAEGTAEGGEAGGGGGLAEITGGNVTTYDVSGATLDDITGQLNHIDGHAASTVTHLGMSGQVTPQRQEDGSLRVEVNWVINGADVTLPNWTDYGAACEAAQQEWDRFMGRTRQHEQQAHIDAANAMVAALPESDRVITGADRDELVANMQAKQNEIAGRIQTMHDGCDHGAAIDAILHPDNGRCETEGEESSGGLEGLEGIESAVE